MNVIKEKFFEILGVAISLITVPVIIFNIPGLNSFFIKGLIALSADLLILTLIMFLISLVTYKDKKKLEEAFNNLYSEAFNLENERNTLKDELIKLMARIDTWQFDNQKLKEELEKINKRIELITNNKRLPSLGQALVQRQGFLSELYEKSQKDSIQQ